MRSRVPVAAAIVAVLSLTGCNQHEKGNALPPVEVVEEPAASAGGACILWDYAFIQRMIGVRFTVAAGSAVADTSTCVLQATDTALPSLVLTVTNSSATEELFAEEAVPAKASAVKGLGTVAYKQVIKESAKAGPTVEVGWLSEAHQMQSLKFTFAKGANTDAVNTMTGQLIALGKVMDTTDGNAKAKAKA